MLKFIFVNDPHCSDTAPRSRKDNYRNAILDKIAEVVELGNHESVNAIFWKGDFFHKKDPYQTSHGLVFELMDILKRFSGKQYIVLGNHDFEGGIDTVVRQPIGVLLKSGFLQLVPDDSPGLVFKDEDAHVVITAGHFSYRMKSLDDSYCNCNFIGVDPAALKIRLVHFAPMIPFEKPDWEKIFSTAGWDIMLSGHLHDRVGIVKSKDGKKLWSCCGAISRGSISESDVKRKPCVELLTVGKDNVYTLEYVDLKKVVPAEEVFRIKEYVDKKNKENELEAFANFVDQRVTSGEYVSLEDRIKIDLEGVDPAVGDLIKLYVERAESGLK